jgi:eukaryotic-like serine/threonine-protein kinase
MGEVYRARDTRLKRDVAVKVLPADVAGNPERLGRFERESHLLASLNHPNIAAIYGVEEAGGTPALVMELVEGEALSEKIARGALPIDEAIAIARQVAEALEYAHERGVIHRDLKPANIVVTGAGAVKVLDFGLAKAITGELSESTASDATHSPTLTSPATRAGVILGTAAYMAPEQARGKTVDRRADIWSFGVVLFEMLTGRRMFEGETISDTIAAILTRAPAFELLPSATPPSVRRLLARCLDRDPRQRLRDIGEARIMLETSSSVADTVPAPAAAQAARRPVVPWIVAGAAIVAAAAWTFVSSRHGDVAPPAIKYAQKTYNAQTILQALYAPDGQTIVFSAATGGSTPYLYSLRPEYTDPLKMSEEPLQLLSISSKGELAVLTRPQWLAHRMCTGTLARMPLAGGAPREIMEGVGQAVWAPDGNDLAISRGVEGVWRLEYPAGKVLYQTGAYISDLRFSPDGKHIAYFEHPAKFDDRGGVAVVDLQGHRKLLADGYWGEEGIAWAPDGSAVYYSAGTGYSDFSIYAATLEGKVRVAAQSAGGLVIHDISARGQWIATRDDQTRVMMVRAPGSDAERDLSWQDLSYPADLSADGRLLLFTNSGATSGNNYQTCTRGTDGSPVVVLGEGGALDLTDDGRWALAGIFPNRIIAYPTGAGKAIELATQSIAHVSDAHWMGGDQKVLLLGGTEGEAERCYAIDVAGGTPQPITEPGVLVAAPSPDGKRILVLGADLKFWIVPVDSSEKRLEVPALSSADDRFADWGQNGQSLFGFNRTRFPSSIDMIDLRTGVRSVITKLEPQVSPVLYIATAVMTPDRSAYAYDAVTYLSRLYTMEGAR